MRFPSAVRRRRLQVAQKCCVMEAMKPTRPAYPGTRHTCELHRKLSVITYLPLYDRAIRPVK